MSDHFLTDFLIDPSRTRSESEERVNHDTRSFMMDMLGLEPPPEPLPPPSQNQVPVYFPTQFKEKNSLPNLNLLSTSTPLLLDLVSQILEELESSLPKLLTLNPSRRDAIAQHLDKLCGVQSRPTDPHSGLRKWIEGPRSPAQNAALRTYFEELAVIALGQALLLKNWSDRGIRKWSESDLGKLNWALSMALKPLMPLDREGWQITRPNLYSWFNLSLKLQPVIWSTLDSLQLKDEGPQFLTTLLGPARKTSPTHYEGTGYDNRFFHSLWNSVWNDIDSLGGNTDSLSMKRNKIAFTPTLRDGSLVRTGPHTIQWIGLESSYFQLMIAELMHIWWKPTPPPLWCQGTGIEAHSRDQLAFSLGSPKPSVLSRIAEMEACDTAFVLEETILRAQGKSPSSVQFREQLESLPYFKKLKAAGTSLGTLQACVALSKLRPGGVLFWAREESLGMKEGNEVLNFLLEKSRLICEWDFSELEHSLPVATPLYPKHLYLFQKEPNIEARLAHRPIRHTIQGQMRSHVELPLVLEDAFSALKSQSQSRGHWAVHSYTSPTCQRDWLEKWPSPTSHQQVRELDQLRTSSLPLAHFTTIRPTPEGDSSRGGKWESPFSPQESKKCFWITHESDSEGRKLITRPLPRPGQETQGHGFLVLVSNESWISPLCAYLMSDWVQKWLDHHAERRGERWILNEQVVKWIPIPRSLLRNLGVATAVDGMNESLPAATLSLEWQKLLSDVSYQPRAVFEALQALNSSEPLSSHESAQAIHAAVFVKTARAIDYLYSSQHRLFDMVSPDGRIHWRELLDVLPKSECIPISIHPKIRLTGSLPPHLPIGKMDRVKNPSAGVLLATESGFTLHIGCEIPLFLNMIWEQLDGISHPTWNELIQYLRLPRRAELAETTALDVLRSHGDQSIRLKELRDLLAICQLF